MSGPARVTSIAVLQTLATALARFRGEAANAMDDLEIELRRALEWIHSDRKDYWLHEARRASDAVTQARIQLQQAKVSRRMAGHEPSCIDEQRALERAKRRLQTAEQRIEAVRHWTHTIDRAVDDFIRSRTQFLTWLDADTPAAVAALHRMSQSLESYISLETPTDPGSPLRGLAQAAADSEPSTQAAQSADSESSEPPKEAGP